MTAPDAVLDLVERFARNREEYLNPAYNETQARREFIDPFFTALGWDVDNTQGFAPQYRDVAHEDAIKVGGSTKAPDYCFRVGGTRKFFVEAKKPAVNLKDDPAPAYQLRRYAWSAKLPLSILTDFQEFVVYDCRVTPAASDESSAARTLYVTCEQYGERWDEIADVFAKRAVYRGSFDKYAESTKAKKGTAEVDKAFLGEIEGWRDALARNIALRNHLLKQREMNYAVQTTIDRIIFLRICEDRGIEPYGRLQVLCQGDGTYGRLKALFHEADARYNSGLFHFSDETGRTGDADRLTLGLVIDDKPLKEIASRLYYPESPYEFSVLPADILGQVYEQFLGKVIRLTAGHRAVIEDKPEVKKAGGVYYTPTYIVDYIVKNTVGRLLDGKTPKQAADLRILDPACGSGSFLLGAYQHLLDWHLKEYSQHPEKHRKELAPGRAGQWQLATAEKKRILLANIYGVDIDAQAVETTKLSLLLKVLEGETAATIDSQLSFLRERALPDLAANIRCGNSLISSDYFAGRLSVDPNELELINAFDWEHEFPLAMAPGGFDCVVGNPPYDVLEKQRGEASWPHAALAEYVRDHDDYAQGLGGKLNLFRFFIVRSKQLVRPGGRFGMIVPMALLGDISCAKTRRSFFAAFDDIEADCFPQKDNRRRRVFLDAKLSTVVLCATRRGERAASGVISVRTYPWNSFADAPKQCSISLDDLRILDPKALPVPLVDQPSWDLCRKLHLTSGVRRLGELADYSVTRGEINQTIYREFITSAAEDARLLKGVEVRQYGVNQHLQQGHREWLDGERFLTSNTPRKAVQRRRIATQRITGVDESLRVVATLVDPPCYFAASTNSIVARDDDPDKLRYLLAILNSRLTQWRFRLTSTNNNVGTNELECLPVMEVVASHDAPGGLQTELAQLSGYLLTLHEALSDARSESARTAVQRQIDARRAQIDRLIYALYGLTDDETALVEAV
jgi:predicted type IV restriction endonuclease